LVGSSVFFGVRLTWSDGERRPYPKAIEEERAERVKELAAVQAKVAAVVAAHDKELSGAIALAGFDRKVLEAESLKTSKEMQQAASPEAALKILQEYADRNRAASAKIVASVSGADVIRQHLLNALGGGPGPKGSVEAPDTVGAGYEVAHPPTRDPDPKPGEDPKKEKKPGAPDVEEYDISAPFHDVDAHNSTYGLRSTRTRLETGDIFVQTEHMIVGASNPSADQDASIWVPITVTRPASEVQVSTVFRDADSFRFDWDMFSFIPGVLVAHATCGVQLWDAADQHVDGQIGEWWLAASIGIWRQSRAMVTRARPYLASVPAGTAFPATLRVRVFISEGLGTVAWGGSTLTGRCHLDHVHVRVVH
jgi:hypothetical protein